MDASVRLALVLGGAIAFWYWYTKKKQAAQTPGNVPIPTNFTVPIPSSFTNGGTDSSSFDALLDAIINNPQPSDDTANLINQFVAPTAAPVTAPMPATTPQNDPFYYQRREVAWAANAEAMIGAGGQ